MTEDQPATLISSRQAYAGRLINVDVETVRNPAGATFELEMVRHPGASAVVPIVSELDSPDPHVLLLRQYRHAADGFIWEIPAGVLEPGEAPEECAHRELQEETGATAGTMEHLTTVYTTPGFTDERIHLFLASRLSVAEQRLESDEMIEVVTRPLSEILKMIRDREVVDSKTIVAILYVAGFRL